MTDESRPLGHSGDSGFAAREAALDRINDNPAWAQRVYGPKETAMTDERPKVQVPPDRIRAYSARMQFKVADLAEQASADEPVGRCSGCRRRTWDATMIGQTCFAPQAGGEPCQGKFNPLPWEDEDPRHYAHRMGNPPDSPPGRSGTSSISDQEHRENVEALGWRHEWIALDPMP